MNRTSNTQVQAGLLMLICLGGLAAVSAALIGQHMFGVRPCPWCVLQRLVFLMIALVAGLGWTVHRIRPTRMPIFALLFVLGVCGVASAYYQHEVASQMASCAMTLADRILTALQLETAIPSLFMVTASCSEASQYRVLGLSYEIWSGALFSATLLLALIGLRKR